PSMSTQRPGHLKCPLAQFFFATGGTVGFVAKTSSSRSHISSTAAATGPATATSEAVRDNKPNKLAEIYRDRLVLYGCGDLVDDYEGIGGYESYRDDLRLLYLVSAEPGTGRLTGARLVPLRARRMRLEHAGAADTAWLRDVLDTHARRHATRVDHGPDGTLTVRPLH
ncbi:hypothetical protein AB0A67_37060, partial [Streptomyces eurythermus]